MINSRFSNIIIGSDKNYTCGNNVIIIGDDSSEKIIIGGLDFKSINRKFKIMNILFQEMQEEIKELKERLTKYENQ